MLLRFRNARERRIGFTSDPVTGRTNVHFPENFGPGDVGVLTDQADHLGTVFLPSRGLASDEDLRPLSDVPMKGLAIWDAPVTDAGIEALAGHRTLKSLNLQRVALTDGAVASIASIPKLNKLHFGYSSLTDEALKQISTIEGLQSLGFFKCLEITDAGVEHLTRLRSLERLFLNNNESLTTGY